MENVYLVTIFTRGKGTETFVVANWDRVMKEWPEAGYWPPRGPQGLVAWEGRDYRGRCVEKDVWA